MSNLLKNTCITCSYVALGALVMAIGVVLVWTAIV